MPHGRDPIDTLLAEHDLIERVLDAMETEARRAHGGLVDALFWRDAVDFCRDFTDGSHHGKEERLLFPALLEVGGPLLTPPVCSSNHGHVEARRILSLLEEALATSVAAACGEAVAAVAMRYVLLQRDHIAQENDQLFAAARQTLRPEQRARLAREFEQVAAHEESTGRVAHQQELANRLLARFRPERAASS